MDKFHKAIMKELWLLNQVLAILSPSLSEADKCLQRYLLQFWVGMEVSECQAWAVHQIGVKMVRSTFAIAFWLAHELWGLTLSYCSKKFFWCFWICVIIVSKVWHLNWSFVEKGEYLEVNVDSWWMPGLSFLLVQYLNHYTKLTDSGQIYSDAKLKKSNVNNTICHLKTCNLKFS